MGSRKGRGKLLVDMITGQISIENDTSSDPFISGSYDPTRDYKQNESYHCSSSNLLMARPVICENTCNEAVYLDHKHSGPNHADSINFETRPNSVLSDATICIEDILDQDVTVTSKSPSIIIHENVLIRKADKINEEEFNHGKSCEVHRCKEEVFSACHKCQILQCWEHFIQDSSCPHHESALNSTKKTFLNKETEAEVKVADKTAVQELAFEDSDYILDERHGWLIEKRQEQTETNPTSLTDIILDDQTGEIVQPDQAKTTKSNSEISYKNNRALNKAQRIKGKPYLKRKVDKKDNQIILVPKPEKTMKMKPCLHESTDTKSPRTYLCGAISDEQRECIFQYFWDLDTWNAKKAYLKNLVRIRPIIRRRKGCDITKKSIGYDCFLPNEYNQMFRVCKKFLLSTLDMNNETLSEWVKSLNDEYLLNLGILKTSENLITADKIRLKSASVKEWLGLLPKVPSHYCRSSSTRVYVESTFLSKTHMFKTYKKWCIDENKPMAQRKLFCLSLQREKISIHKPRKDQCDTCTAFKENNITAEEFQIHHDMKEEAYTAKRDALTMCSSEVLVFTADTQSVLLCPKLLVSEQYYKQKLQIHNYTIYCNNNKDVHLYVWHEGHGDVTSNEYTSCLLDFLELQVNLGYKKLVMFSDGCGYQNRNKVLSSALNDFAKNNSVEIEQRFLEKGHTMMEADSVHSTLEKLFKPPIFLPSDYINLMAQARPSKPYTIHHLDYSFFKNYSKTCKLDSLRPGKKTGDPVVTKIRAILYKNGEIHYKLRHPEDWMKLPQRLQSNRARLSSLYQAERKIEKSKYLSLQSLKKFMHKDNHQFYDSLKN